jgi:hypothetical protein
VVLGTVIISYGEWSLSGQAKPRPAKSEFELRDVTGKSGSISLLSHSNRDRRVSLT